MAPDPLGARRGRRRGVARARPEAPDGAPPPVLRLAAWADIPGLIHGFFGREGGASAGEWASLNVSERVGDEPARVAANWRRVRLAAPLDVVRMRQVHGTAVVRVERAGQPVGAADGLMTDMSGIGLTVLTADCVPLLFVAPAARVAMSVHAGWRGTLAGIAAVALAEARRAYGVELADWRVAMGPSIGRCCYEVETAIGEQLVDRWGAMPEAWEPAGARGQLDLRQANRRILEAQGIEPERIADVGPCTACDEDRYFSHRRSRGRAGRQVSLIGWRAAPG